ncbi:MAG: hypothetical protein AAFY88_14550 [Acidobacteriota bacterium]
MFIKRFHRDPLPWIFLLLGLSLSAGALAEAPTAIVDSDEFRISAMGPDGDETFDGRDASVAYDRASNEYLVVWSGDTDDGELVEGESEIWGQRLDADTGAPLGARLRLSDMGPDGSTGFSAERPDVAYNPRAGEFLVVWHSTDDTIDSTGEIEIWGQRIEAGTGAEVGSNDFRISNQGPDGASNSDARRPAVAYNPVDDEYLVVWDGDGGMGLENDEFEIFGQRLEGASGARLSEENFRISQMGPDGDDQFDAGAPDVAHNVAQNEYLVVWGGDSDEPGDNIFAIWGQVLDGATGEAIGDHRRISTVTLNNQPNFDTRAPAIAHAVSSNHFLVVFPGDLSGDRELEIFGQLVDGETLVDVGFNRQLSDMGPDGNRGFDAEAPAVVYAPERQEFQVLWRGDDNTAPYQNDEFEIFGQRLDASGSELGGDLGLSRFGPQGQTRFGADSPAAAVGPGGQVLVVFEGDTDDGERVDDEFEIHGLLPPLFADGFESGDLSAWSNVIP